MSSRRQISIPLGGRYRHPSSFRMDHTCRSDMRSWTFGIFLTFFWSYLCEIPIKTNLSFVKRGPFVPVTGPHAVHRSYDPRGPAHGRYHSSGGSSCHYGRRPVPRLQHPQEHHSDDQHLLCPQRPRSVGRTRHLPAREVPQWRRKSTTQQEAHPVLTW